MKETLDIKVDEAWNNAQSSWNSPSVPQIIAPRTQEEITRLGEVGTSLRNELAFMQFPSFQTYANIPKIVETFSEDPQKGTNAVLSHEIGHRFCPYDLVTLILLRHAVKKTLQGQSIPYNVDTATGVMVNLYADETVNTRLAKTGHDSIVWAYRQISKGKQDSKLWKVYAKSMELLWDASILPESTTLDEQESIAAREIADVLGQDYFDRSKWRDKARAYASILSKFLEEEHKDKECSLDDIASNVPKELDENTVQEIAKRLAKIGSNGLPKNPAGLSEFKEIMAGFGEGNPTKASITFYDRLSESYQVMFAQRALGRPRRNPFQPVKWTPSLGIDKLDIDYSVMSGGRIIPGVNTYTWKTRQRQRYGGMEEIVPDLDIYLDSSSSLPNPIDHISLPVLAGFVVAKKAHRKGAKIRSTNFSGNNQSTTQETTRDLYAIYQNLVTYYGGGTVFPQAKLLDGHDPRQVIVITDTFLGNMEVTADAIATVKARNKANGVTIYALHPVINADQLRNAGAEVIHGTTTDIFKRVIGKVDEVYTSQ